MRAPWPSQADYIMALQEPASAFRDPRLGSGEIEADPVLGLPKPRSGQMASVYKLFDGGRTWAVRCFNYSSPERAQRYGAISAYLAQHPNPYTVGFAYDEAGIVVGDGTYPIVSMEWVEGDLLAVYIARHLDAPRVLERLADAWVEMVQYLHALGIAHGDLQHGNVVVTPAGTLKLIDYDGMFVPAFRGAPSSENGHPNYQHPCRSSRHFGPQLDNFSAWVVYLSIIAVARDPSVWTALRFGDECLALRAADYVRPSASDAFALLGAACEPDVGNLGRYVRSLLSHEPDALPALEACPHLAPFDSEPLAAGAYREPYLPGPTAARAAEPSRKPLPAGAVRAGAGVAATAAGSAALHALGFAGEQVVAIAVLGWMLAGIIAVASRSPKPPAA